ncbi:MAG: hypothetical protein Q8Q11_01485 [bacterium]|nr:hypothetical protein [bacterium]MDZ4248077.1 hypothetical protein [Patescibacteria group bacterium]
MIRHETPRWKKILYALFGLLVLAGIVAAIFYLRRQQPPPPPVIPVPTPTETPRSLSNEKFGNRARPLSAANVDVGVLTVRIGTPSPRASAAPIGRSLGAIAQLAPYRSRPASPSPSPPSSTRRTIPTALPSVAPTAEPLPTFDPLPSAPAPIGREFALVYAKGAVGKRQIYLRSVERDDDEALVNSVFDDYGVSFSSPTQKVAFYSNEEGASDEDTNRSKLKVVDIASRKVVTIAKKLPGTWPAAWSPDGKKLAIPAERSIIIADITTGKSRQVETGQLPGALAWNPDGVSLYYQVERSEGNDDIIAANIITKRTEPVADSDSNEHDVAVSVDGTRISYLQGQGLSGDALVVQALEGGEPRVFPETRPANSFVMNRTLSETVFVRGGRKPKLSVYVNGTVKNIGDLANPVLVGWDRDYEYVLVLADDDKSRALFSVKVKNGDAQKLKGGVSDTVPVSKR